MPELDNLATVGCAPVPPCNACGASACNHLRTAPAMPKGARRPFVAVEMVRGPDGLARGQIEAR